MTVHLLRLSVGTRDVEHLCSAQAARGHERRDGTGTVRAVWTDTRRAPRRREDLVDGGALYWVIGGVIRCRQRILDVDGTLTDADGRSFCRIFLEQIVILTDPVPHRPFQGWRYMEVAQAPQDLADGSFDDEMPAAMRAELRALGLL